VTVVATAGVGIPARGAMSTWSLVCLVAESSTVTGAGKGVVDMAAVRSDLVKIN
jgi:hypothetical protein